MCAFFGRSSSPKTPGPLAHNVRPDTYLEINNFYTATIYEKGAEIIRMLKVLIGDDAFRAGMDLYFARYDGTAATIEDFISCFAQSSGRDLTQFSRWYDQSGTPLVKVEASYDGTQGSLTLDIRQSSKPTPGQPTKKPFVIPIDLGLIAHDGTAIVPEVAAQDGTRPEELTRGVIELSTPHRRVTFRNLPKRPVVSLLRGFSAPVRLSYAASEKELLTLIRYDSDSFNRWQASQTYATRLLLRSVERIHGGQALDHDSDFAAALQRVLEDGGKDPAFTAQVLALPGEADIAREIGEDVDPQAIHTARETLRQALSRRLAPTLLATYEALRPSGPYSPDAAAAGRRALRNAALDLYAAGNQAAGATLALRQFESADTMTDEIAALGVLALLPGPQREAALATFYAKHAREALVIDKWFVLQAAIPEPETLARVRGLMAHPAFSLANPNRVRSLIGAFATANQTQFNAPDGSGYAFLVDIVLDLDDRNPQVAARLLSAFKELAGAGAGTPPPGGGRAAPRRQRRDAVGRCSRHRPAFALLGGQIGSVVRTDAGANQARPGTASSNSRV